MALRDNHASDNPPLLPEQIGFPHPQKGRVNFTFEKANQPFSGGNKSFLPLGVATPKQLSGAGLYHRYNAVLKRVSGDKSRAQMTLSELEATIGWLERNRLSEHLHLLEDDPRYAWSARKRGKWKPPVGRAKSKGRPNARDLPA